MSSCLVVCAGLTSHAARPFPPPGSACAWHQQGHSSRHRALPRKPLFLLSLEGMWHRGFLFFLHLCCRKEVSVPVSENPGSLLCFSLPNHVFACCIDCLELAFPSFLGPGLGPQICTIGLETSLALQRRWPTLRNKGHLMLSAGGGSVSSTWRGVRADEMSSESWLALELADGRSRNSEDQEAWHTFGNLGVLALLPAT